MKIAHFALWTQQLDVQARFWVDFFAASINEKYLSQTNPGFASYFVTIDDEVVIELMTKPGLQQAGADNNHLRLGASGPLGGRGGTGRCHRPTRRGRRNTDFAAAHHRMTAIMRR